MIIIPKKRLAVRVFNLLSSCGGKSGSEPFGVNDLMNQACKKTGLADFGEANFMEALEQLVFSLNETGGRHAFGQLYIHSLVKSMLITRLELVALWKKNPEILEERIKSPVIILGLPRTGTSFLFNLLSQDPSHRFLANWEATVSPIAPKGKYDFLHDPRRKKGQMMMRLQNYICPDMAGIHTFQLDGPEECTPIQMQSFATQSFASMLDIPSYDSWLDRASYREVVRHHRRVLQTLQFTYPAKRWLLKAPGHTPAVGELLKTYPDAKVIHIYRDPAEVIPSCASLSMAFRGICYKSVNTEKLGDLVLSRYSKDVDRYIDEQKKLDALRFFNIQYKDFVKNPLGTVSKLYSYFEMDQGGEVMPSMQRFLQRDKASKKQHHYTPEQFGLTSSQIRQSFSRYISTFSPKSKSVTKNSPVELQKPSMPSGRLEKSFV